MRRAIIMAATALALAGCGSEREGTVQTDDGEVAYQVDRDGDAVDATITGPDGETVRAQSGPGANLDLPAGFTAYPGATVVTSSTVTTSDGGGSIVLMTSPDSVEDVIAFYRNQAAAAGVQIDGVMSSNGTQVIGGEAGDGTALSVSATQAGGGTTQIQLTVGRGG